MGSGWAGRSSGDGRGAFQSESGTTNEKMYIIQRVTNKSIQVF